jgi:hypothetical protein
MRTPSAAKFHETLNYCFTTILASVGNGFQDKIYEVLEKKGIKKEDVTSRFDHVITVLTESLGPSARVLLFKTVEALYREYSMPTQISYDDSLKDRIILLQSKVETEHLNPKHTR